MKRILILFLVTVCVGSLCAQNARVKVSGSPIRIGELLEQIESQTDYLFVYNKKNVDVRRTVAISTDYKATSLLLTEAFGGTDITYVMEGNNIVLIKSTEAPAVQSGVTLRGLVTDMRGEPIIGANIIQQESGSGTVTNTGGYFSIDTDGDILLNVSYVGYKSQTIPVKGRTQFTIRLEEETTPLETVVVTAMGIERKEQSLTYATQVIQSNELTRAKDANMINSLAGKSSGVLVNRSSSGLGGSVKVNIRGTRSINGNNQPLYVIDGVPMLNSSNTQVYSILGGVADTGNRDNGDGISNLNPEDIENINILKGASAAALYGSQAANGVILITTKKGKAGVQRATFSSSITSERAISLPEFQNNYGIDDNKKSWGEKGKLTDYNNVDNFFRTGLTSIHSFSFTKGKEAIQTYFSYGNTYGKGIVEGISLNRHNVNFRQTASFFGNRLMIDGNVNMMYQTLRNRPTPGGYYMNPLVGLYGFPRGENLKTYRENFEVHNDDRNMNVQNWYKDIDAFEQNPYWITKRSLSKDTRYRTIGNLNVNLKVTDWLTLQARGTADYVSDKYTQRMYASTAVEIAGIYTPDGSEVSYANGRYINLDQSELLLYGDVMALFNRAWNNWSVSGAIGTSINSTKVNSLRLDSKQASLYYPNVFTVSNIVMNTKAYINEKINERRQLQSVFGTAQLGWRESVYLDVTARNDWSSTLAFTEKSSFFYPSVGVSWIISKTQQLPKWISFGKVRASWSQVGNDLPLFYSRLQDKIIAGGDIQSNDRAPFDKLKPELSSSFEVGTEWKFLDHRLDVDFTFYQTDTKNQLLTLPSTAGATHKYYMVNAGKIRNRGVELTVGATPVMTTDFQWRTSVNYSANKNTVIKLHPDLISFVYGEEGFSMNYAMRLKEGGSMGDIYGWKFDRDEMGNIKLDNKGMPTSIGSGNTEKVGNSNPDFMFGWSNTLSYKRLSLYFLIDARVGGDVLSQTQAELDYRGVSVNSGKARDRGYVEYGGHRFTDVLRFYNHVSSRNGTITEYYMYSATNIRLRELSLAYSLPRSILEKTRVIHGLDLSLIARNLFFFHKDAPFDPDAVMSTDNSCQGVDVFGMPTTRSVGFNVKFTF